MQFKSFFFVVLVVGMLASCSSKTENSMNLSRGAQQVAVLWTPADGSEAEMMQFIADNECQTDSERLVLFESLSRILERMYESADLLTVELLKPTQLTNGAEPQTPDWIMSGYSPLAHFADDMFANKLAFVTILNFPHYTLEEKNTLGRNWTRQEWAYARMGDVFTTRVPAAVNTQMAQALGGLFVENVVGIHLLVLHLAGLGQAKALGGAAVGLLLGHG